MLKALRKRRSTSSGYLFIFPAALLMLVFIAYPLVSSVQISLNRWSGIGKMVFIGLDNYRDLIHDPVFWESILHTFMWALMSVVILALSGLSLALIVDIGIPFKRFTAVARTILFMPMMMSMVAIGLMWALIFNPMMGLLNEALRFVGLIKPLQTIDFLGSYNSALFVTFIPVIWQWSGFGMVIFSAAMQGIPSEVIEASIVDGCSKPRQIWHIVLPLLKPTIALVCTLNLIGAFKAFDIIFVMTAGGPGTSTQVTSIYIFRQAFVNNTYGYSAAISFALFIVTVVFGLLFFRFSKRIDNYI